MLGTIGRQICALQKEVLNNWNCLNVEQAALGGASFKAGNDNLRTAESNVRKVSLEICIVWRMGVPCTQDATGCQKRFCLFVLGPEIPRSLMKGLFGSRINLLA